MKHINICICTFHRPQMLARLLKLLSNQNTAGLFTYSIVVVDNDAAESARAVVEAFAALSPIATHYDVEPVQNIAMARNRAISHSSGDFIAMIDDDEEPGTNWLKRLFTAIHEFEADGVLGPVLPRFMAPPPAWVVRGMFFSRHSPQTGTWLNAGQMRTGNVLLKREIVDEPSSRFRIEYGHGGEDVDFFQRATTKGRRFVWCAEAPVYEVVSPERCSRSYVLKRALGRGRAPYNHRWSRLIKSLVALPVYTLALPVLFCCGQHRFMQSLVKICDHFGRIIAFLGINLLNPGYVTDAASAQNADNAGSPAAVADFHPMKMAVKLPHISVCICTYKRPQLLKRLLEDLSRQQTDDQFTFSIVVAENDDSQSAQEIVSNFAASSAIPVRYCLQTLRNIALTRNATIENANGDFIAFIDDDEFPTKQWLLALFQTLGKYNAHGVLGPVMPYFQEDVPKWIVKGGLFDRPMHKTGISLEWDQTRTGNVLLKRELFTEEGHRFDPNYLAGSDQDFFRRMMQIGHTFIWCNEAVVYETVPPARWKRSFLVRRAIFKGIFSYRNQPHAFGPVLWSMISAFGYALALPLIFVLGQAMFMSYLFSFSYHVGRLLGLFGFNPIRESYVSD